MAGLAIFAAYATLSMFAQATGRVNAELAQSAQQ